MDTKQVLKAMTREEKAALVCGTGRDSTFSIRALPSLKFVYGGFGRGGVRMPSAFALACSFDERAAYEAGLEEGRRCCASGEHVTADVPPLLPFCGENDGGRYRGFSSDSTLTMSLAAAYIDKIFKILSVCSTRIPHLNCYNSTLCEKIQISLDYKNLFTYTKSITKLRSQ